MHEERTGHMVPSYEKGINTPVGVVLWGFSFWEKGGAKGEMWLSMSGEKAESGGVCRRNFREGSRQLELCQTIWSFRVNVLHAGCFTCLTYSRCWVL